MKPTEPDDGDPFLRDLGDTLGASSGGAVGLGSVAASLGSVAASAGSRALLLAGLHAYDRFERFESAVADLLQLSRSEAAAALRRIDDASAWLPQGPGIAFLPVAGGPEAGFFLSGFLRVEAGVDFPEHEHLGEEVTLVLQGAFEESVSGIVFRPGEPAHMAAGTRHRFRVPADGPHLVGLATVKVGMRLVPTQSA